MMSTETWPRSAVRVWTVAQRFQKFLVVGAVGLAVNQGLLLLLTELASLPVRVASPIAIAASMVVTFWLNEAWTWNDRGSGRIFNRALFYAPINTVGLFINWGVLLYLHEEWGMHLVLANFVGAGIAAVWNFLLNHLITWRA